MAEAGVTTPYSSLTGILNAGAAPGWVPEIEAERLLSYGVYENIYWNVSDAYKLVARSDGIAPIYVPSGRTIVDTTNRYVGTGMDFVVQQAVDPVTGASVGSNQDLSLAGVTFQNFFRREKFKSRYAMNKRFGLIRGDWLWHIVADPAKVEGSRISIRATDPGSWFPVYDDDDLDKLIRVYLVDPFLNEKGEDRIKKLTYEYADPETNVGEIMWHEEVYEWGEFLKNGSPESVLTPPTVLPAEIPSFPVYQVKNFEEPANPYGSSELRGVERIVQAISQAMSDEDLALALEGLGVYATDGGGPVDEEGEDEDWNLGPGEVVENALNFRRVSGVGSLQPYGDHLGRLRQYMLEASNTPETAIGKVDVTVAESGVALLLQLGPMLAKAAEKDQEIVDVHTQMFHDLKAWFQVYEGITLLADVVPTLGDKLPVNRKQEITDTATLVAAGIMSVQSAQEYLAEKGIKFATDEIARLASEAEAKAAAATSEIDARMNAELETAGGASA